MNDNALMNKVADNIRVLSASMVEKAKSGHPGGPMGGADFINVLYSEFLEYDPENPNWEGRDRFFLDAGHMSPMLYATLALTGKYTLEELMQFRQWGSPTPGHPEVDVARGVENTSGPLGQGHTFAVGAAMPLAVVLLAPEQSLLYWVVATAIVFLAMLGAAAAAVGGTPPLKSALRVAFWGTFAMAVTAGVGAMFGAAV